MSTKTKSVKTKPLVYATSLGKTPKGYECGVCGIKGVKLWREYNTFLCYQTLYCVECGRGGEPPKYADLFKPITATEWGECDQMTHPKAGSLVPAVPTEDGDTYWGYTSVPSLGVVWWRSLPRPDWTNEVLLQDFEKNLGYVDMFEDSIRRNGENEYYRGLIDNTSAAIEVIRNEILRRMEKN